METFIRLFGEILIEAVRPKTEWERCYNEASKQRMKAELAAKKAK